eukprot:CAMPEP_0171447100 /NCGR_PEP_ID=MMETSP0881-20121228/38931_1 /TAXON_ID=67004 /ORGANISM="Thalassiosira weissflogii, Strain CCMP1336" /LENGTH=243 /DNA_ID=CAMNT_0011971503 /DNA_START=448 /DNA_END=1179 /DNA_ORIENTATION=+
MDNAFVANKDLSDDNLLEGLSAKSFPRAFDVMEPDYDSFILAYVSKDPYAMELVERFAKLDAESNVANDDKGDPAMTTPNKPKNEKSGIVGDGVPRTEKEFVEFLIRAERQDKGDPAMTTPNTPKNEKSGIVGDGVPRTEKEFVEFLIRAERQRDTEIVQQLARDVLAKSDAINEMVANLPGMYRTRQMQMKRIDELLQSCHSVARELEDAHRIATEKREEVRKALEECTCSALGVEEEGIFD